MPPIPINTAFYIQEITLLDTWYCGLLFDNLPTAESLFYITTIVEIVFYAEKYHGNFQPWPLHVDTSDYFIVQPMVRSFYLQPPCYPIYTTNWRINWIGHY